MRWLVDVTPLGNDTGTETVQVDADSWQNALLVVRTRRGESGLLNGFSIQLLAGGDCRALDPSSGIRYDVRNVVEREPAAPAHETSTDAAPRSRVPPRVTSALPPRPSTQPRISSKTAGSAPSPSVPENTGTMGRPAPPAVLPAVVSLVDDSVATAGSRAGDSTAVATSPTPAADDREPSPPEARAAPASDVDLVSSQIIFKREQERTPAQPITYREYIYLVPRGTSDEAAELLLQRQLERVQASLAQVAAGKLIHLAAFDVQFHGKPPVAPIATLIWKDWLGSPVVALPRRGAPEPSARRDPSTQPAAADATQADTREASSRSETAETAVAAAPGGSNGVGAVATGDALSLPAEHSDELSPRAEPPDEPRPPRPISPRQPGTETKRGARGEDLIADLFEAMHDLHFLRDAVEGGAFCLALCVEKIPCSTGMVHLYDIDRREYLVTNTHGALARPLLLRRTSEADPVLAAATRRRHAISVTYAEENEARNVERYDAIGGARRVLVAPVMQAGRYLGALELIDPLDGQPFTETEANAMTYIAGQFADFVAARGIVTDPERIGALAR
ncbi:MAG TPA: hypothetical protein VEK07_03585 [Polyangiaceae bacterium]|nr:hypothetical protein [Polyangiaceae bacterium]